MKNGNLLLAIAGTIQALQTAGYIDASGEFVSAKFDDVAADVALASAIAAVWTKAGAAVPVKVMAVIEALPAFVPLIQALTK